MKCFSVDYTLEDMSPLLLLATSLPILNKKLEYNALFECGKAGNGVAKTKKTNKQL